MEDHGVRESARVTDHSKKRGLREWRDARHRVSAKARGSGSCTRQIVTQSSRLAAHMRQRNGYDVLYYILERQRTMPVQIAAKPGGLLVRAKTAKRYRIYTGKGTVEGRPKYIGRVIRTDGIRMPVVPDTIANLASPETLEKICSRLAEDFLQRREQQIELITTSVPDEDEESHAARAVSQAMRAMEAALSILSAGKARDAEDQRARLEVHVRELLGLT